MFNFFTKRRDPIDFWFSTDIHCHIVPGVDDGSPDVDTSVQLVRDLRDMGIRRIIATPHVTDVTFMNSAETLAAPFESLRQGVAAAGIDIDLAMSAENRIDDLMTQNIEAKTLLTHPGGFALIENSFVQEPWALEDIIFNISVRGYKPIWAHPERFSYYQGKTDRYKALHQLIPFQVNVLSLAGYYGPQVRKTAEWLIEKGFVDYLGTDCHGARHIECFREYLASKAALRHRDALAGRIHNDIDFAHPTA